MPRLTDKQYLAIHDRLRRYWLNVDRIYAELTPTEQWQLHDYFQPSKDLTSRELVTHRTTITARRPTLPQQAGRALAKLDAAAAHWAINRSKVKVLAGSKSNKRNRVIRVKALVKPEPDLKQLAQAAVAMAKHLAEEVQARQQDDHDEAA